MRLHSGIPGKILSSTTSYGVSIVLGMLMGSVTVPTLAGEEAEERYVLVMSRNDELCGHMLDRFNADLRKYGWNGDAHKESLPEFTAVPWDAVRVADAHGHVDEVLHESTRGAVLDIDNDGVDEFVVRFSGSLSGLRADSLFVFPGDVAAQADSLQSSMLWNSPNMISLAGSSYTLAERKEKLIDPRVISPFLHDGVSYILMRGLFEANKTWGGYAVVARYGGACLQIESAPETWRMFAISSASARRASRTKH